MRKCQNDDADGVVQKARSGSVIRSTKMEQVINAPPQDVSMTRNAAVVVSLEEELAMHEATLQNLLTRQQALQVEEARRQRQLHLDRLEALQTRRETLQEARQQHLNLQGEIAEALEKSRERLTRVMVAAGVPQDDDDEEDTDAIIEEEDGDEQAVVTKETIQEEEEQVDNTEQEEEGVCIAVPNIHLKEEVMTDFLKSHDGGLGVFLPCLNSANLIHRLMNVAALETLALDKAQPEGNHRQEALWKTCLDFLCTASRMSATAVSAPTDVSAANASPTEQEGDIVIDANVALCPYELAGECADPFCPYQHIKPRNISEQQILARERLPLPTLKLPDTPSSIHNSAAVLVAAQEPEFTPPHSPLRKRRRIEGNEQEDEEEEEEESVKTAPPQDDEESIRTQLQSEDEAGPQQDGDSADEDDKEESGGDGQVSMDWNDDFLSLPPMTKTATEERDDSASSSSTDENQTEVNHQDDATDENHAEVSVQELWWHSDVDVARMKESPGKLSTLRLSLTDWLEVVAGIQMEHVSGDGASSLVIKVDGYPTTSMQAVAVLGRVVDCVRLCVHAGRFELTYALCEYARNCLKNVFPETDDVNDSDECSAIGSMVRMVLELLEKSRDAAFNFNSDWRPALGCAFEAEMPMATLGTGLKFLHERLSNEEEVDAWLSEWSKILDKAFPLLSQRNRAPSVRSTQATPTTWKEISKDWESASEAASNEESDSLLRLENLVTALEGGRKAMDKVAQCPMELLVDEVLKPALSEVRLFENKLNDEDPKEVVPFLFKMGYIILGCSQSACARIVSGGDHQGVDSSATMTAIDSCIYQIVTCLANIASTEPLAELSLAPLYALSVSLASTLRRYGKAQRRLEAALNVVLAKGQRALCGGYLIYSELLWSQLIQLRSFLPLLPDKDEGKRAASLSVSTKLEHRTIASTVNAFGVQPNHVTLCGDCNMLKAFDVSNRKYATLAHVRKYCHSLFQLLFTQRQQATSSLFCNLWHLPLVEIDMPMRSPASSPSLAFPQSTLLAGRNLSVLVANKCNLKELPLTFGMYFPNLKVLKLAENSLTELPDSIGKLSSLCDLDVSHNRLQSLPSTMRSLKQLTRLDATHNELSAIDKSITKCKSLEELLLTNNPLERKDLPSDLTLRCTNLYKIDVDTSDGGEE